MMTFLLRGRLAETESVVMSVSMVVPHATAGEMRDKDQQHHDDGEAPAPM